MNDEVSEAQRLAELHAYQVLDTPPEPAFDGLVQAAAVIAEVPTVLIGLIDSDRQWYKAKLGMDQPGVARDIAFCDHVVRDGQEIIVPDARTDPRFAAHPMVTGPDGIRFYAGFPLRAPSGAVLGTLCVVDAEPHRLTEQQYGLLRTLAAQVMTQLQLRRELLEREQQLRRRDALTAQLEQAQQVAGVGSFTYDVATREITWSRELKRIFGVPDSFEPDLDSYRTLVHPDDRDLLGGTIAEASARGGLYQVEHRLVRPEGEEPGARELTYLCKDGTRRLVHLTVNSMFGPDGTHTGYIGVATDITERRELERERDEHAMMLRAVIQNNQSVIYVRDLQGHFLMVNRAFEEAFGVRESDLLGRDPFGDAPHADQWRANNLRAVDGPYRVEEAAELADGTHVYDAVKVPLKDARGRTYAICGLSLDITERRRAEAETAKAVEAMVQARDAAIAGTKAKSAFLATMSHEIRTPMNAVIGITGLLLDSPLDAEQRDLLETVRGSGDQLLSIINDILDFSKIEAGDLELESHPFDLRETVESTIAQFAGAAGDLDLISHLTETCPAMVVGDVVRLRQVLANLVGNAIKFTDHGDVLVRVEPDPGPPPAGTDPEAVRLRFTVADTGIGISPESMDRLFRSFSQVDASTTRVYGGTGLGLAISKAIVEAMGGDLTVTSTPGIGSEFTFGVVLGRFQDRRAQVRPDTGSADLTRLAGHSVLIVDDNDTNRRILRLQLERHGMLCTTSASALDAVALVGAGRVFDLAILDYAMPMMDGIQLAMALRQLPAGQRLPLILLSSIGRREREDATLFSAVLTKPTRTIALFEAISQVLAPDAVVAIPRPAEPVDPDGPLPTAEPAEDSARLRILLAEDNEVNQKVGRLMLGRIGHRVDIAENGRDALEAVRRTRYDVVLMDMHMPVMDGLEATRRIRAELPPDQQPRIIAMTASVTTQDRIACTHAGMDGYLPKPVRPADLVTALATTPTPHPTPG